jgi:hypothetical protein
MVNTYIFNRVDFIRALKEWCKDEFNPKVAFPSKEGYQNVAYLYDDKADELVERGRQLMEFLYSKLNMPVMVFSHPMNRLHPTTTALTCDEWLKVITA